MDKSIMEKLNTIESLLNQLNAKIDNFLGIEALFPDEKKEVDSIRAEVEVGEFDTFKDVFEE
jgi:hypothetical protein